MTDPFATERAATEVAECLNLLLDSAVPQDIVQDVYDNLPAQFDKRLILSLVRGLWPDPDQCPDGC